MTPSIKDPSASFKFLRAVLVKPVTERKELNDQFEYTSQLANTTEEMAGHGHSDNYRDGSTASPSLRNYILGEIQMVVIFLAILGIQIVSQSDTIL